MQTNTTFQRFYQIGAAGLFLFLLLNQAGMQALAQAKPGNAGSSAAAFKLVIKNGGMTQGGDVPAAWNGKFGDAQLARDTRVFKTGPASFRVSVSGGKSGSGFQTITGGAGAKFTLAGWFKTSGAVKAQVMVQAFAEGNKQNQFIQVKYAQGETDWIAFAKEITLPPWTASFNIGLLVEGNGSAWLDEVHEASTAIDKGTSGDAMTSGPPEKDKPAVPGWGFYPQFPNAWLATHQGFVERAKRGDIDVIFYGDSITQGWGIDGKAIWDKRYAPYKAVNFGMGGDSTRQVLWRITHGELDGLHPKLVVLMIGTNNLYSDFNAGTDGEIADGIGLIVDELRQKLPNVRVLLMGLLPRQNEYFCQRIANINLTISKLAGRNRQVRFLDLGPQFMSAPGVVMPKLYNADQLHLVGAGYQVWADAMQPLFDSMLGKNL